MRLDEWLFDFWMELLLTREDLINDDPLIVAGVVDTQAILFLISISFASNLVILLPGLQQQQARKQSRLDHQS